MDLNQHFLHELIRSTDKHWCIACMWAWWRIRKIKMFSLWHHLLENLKMSLLVFVTYQGYNYHETLPRLFQNLGEISSFSKTFPLSMTVKTQSRNPKLCLERNLQFAVIREQTELDCRFDKSLPLIMQTLLSLITEYINKLINWNDEIQVCDTYLLI